MKTTHIVIYVYKLVDANDMNLLFWRVTNNVERSFQMRFRT